MTTTLFTIVTFWQSTTTLVPGDSDSPLLRLRFPALFQTRYTSITARVVFYSDTHLATTF